MPGRKVIGRTPDNDLQIDSKFISRHHCQLITGSDGVSVIEDLNSTNGIVIRGKRMRRHTLRDGDVISIGQHELLYVDESNSQHLSDTHDDLKALDADAANEDADEDDDDARRRGARALGTLSLLDRAQRRGQQVPDHRLAADPPAPCEPAIHPASARSPSEVPSARAGDAAPKRTRASTLRNPTSRNSASSSVMVYSLR